MSIRSHRAPARASAFSSLVSAAHGSLWISPPAAIPNRAAPNGFATCLIRSRVSFTRAGARWTRLKRPQFGVGAGPLEPAVWLLPLPPGLEPPEGCPDPPGWPELGCPDPLGASG